jgi:hypothetical protein
VRRALGSEGPQTWNTKICRGFSVSDKVKIVNGFLVGGMGVNLLITVGLGAC